MPGRPESAGLSGNEEVKKLAENILGAIAPDTSASTVLEAVAMAFRQRASEVEKNETINKESVSAVGKTTELDVQGQAMMRLVHELEDAQAQPEPSKPDFITSRSGDTIDVRQHSGALVTVPAEVSEAAASSGGNPPNNPPEPPASTGGDVPKDGQLTSSDNAEAGSAAPEQFSGPGITVHTSIGTGIPGYDPLAAASGAVAPATGRVGLGQTPASPEVNGRMIAAPNLEGRTTPATLATPALWEAVLGERNRALEERTPPQHRAFLRELRDKYRALPLWQRVGMGALLAGAGVGGTAAGVPAFAFGAFALGRGLSAFGTWATLDALTEKMNNRYLAGAISTGGAAAAAILLPKGVSFLNAHFHVGEHIVSAWEKVFGAGGAHAVAAPTAGALAHVHHDIAASVAQAAPPADAAAHAHGALPAAASAPAAPLDPFTHGVFGADVTVKHGDNLWSIIQSHLHNDPQFSSLNPAKQDFIIDAYEKHLEALSPDQLKMLGFASGSVNALQPGNALHLEGLGNAAFANSVFEQAGKLTAAQQASILQHTLEHGMPAVPTAPTNLPEVEPVYFPPGAPVSVPPLPPTAHIPGMSEAPAAAMPAVAPPPVPAAPLPGVPIPPAPASTVSGTPPPLGLHAAVLGAAADDKVLGEWAKQHFGGGLFGGHSGVESAVWKSIQGQPASAIFSAGVTGSGVKGLSESGLQELQKQLAAFAGATGLDPQHVKVEDLVRAGLTKTTI